MASLLRAAIDCGAPPRLARPPVTPDEVAASYAGQEAGFVPDEPATAGHMCGSVAANPAECQSSSE
jgi:hypothetical protein